MVLLGSIMHNDILLASIAQIMPLTENTTGYFWVKTELYFFCCEALPEIIAEAAKVIASYLTIA